MPAISLENVSFSYPKAGTPALDGVTLEIPRGSFFALLGPNGAGKTTLLRLLCGRFANFDGMIRVEDDLRSCPVKFALAVQSKPASTETALAETASTQDVLDLKNCGILLENPGIYPKLSIEEYLSYFAGFYGFGSGACLPGGSLRHRVEELADRLNLPSLKMKMGKLSLGNRQKVQILRALVHNPKLLILDEPVANLDPVSREMVWRLIAEWRQRENGTAIVCSHILAEMESEATDFAIIDKGCVLQTGSVAAALNDSETNRHHGAEFSVKFDATVSVEQIAAALKAAGLTGAQVETRKNTLSDIYRNRVGSF